MSPTVSSSPSSSGGGGLQAGVGAKLSPPPPPPPQPPSQLSRYGSLTGQMFLYAYKRRAAFESPLCASSTRGGSDDMNGMMCCCENKLILLGGLKDGLLPVPYMQDIIHDMMSQQQQQQQADTKDREDKKEMVFREKHWTLVQPILSSSYCGFGNGTLDRDAKELIELLTYLWRYRGGRNFALLGHSTGCQISMHLLRHLYDTVVMEENQQQEQKEIPIGGEQRHQLQSLANAVKLVILQAPISDREASSLDDSSNIIEQHLNHAEKLRREDKLDDMMPRESFGCPITARRYLDLHARGGLDDYFSSDYTDQELSDRLNHVRKLYDYQRTQQLEKARDESNEDATPPRTELPPPLLRVLLAYSGSDQYVPKQVDTELLTRRITNAMNNGSNVENIDDGRRQQEQESRLPTIELHLPSTNHDLSEGNERDISKFVRAVSDLMLHGRIIR